MAIKLQIYYQTVGNNKIIIQIVKFSEVFDPNIDRVSENNKSPHICSISVKLFLAKYKNVRNVSIDHLVQVVNLKCGKYFEHHSTFQFPTEFFVNLN